MTLRTCCAHKDGFVGSSCVMFHCLSLENSFHEKLDGRSNAGRHRTSPCISTTSGTSQLSHILLDGEPQRSPLADSFARNIQPTRKILRRRGDYQRLGIYALFPFVPHHLGIKIAIEEAMLSPRGGVNNRFDDTLGRILNFQPLLECFQEFCRKSLCSEVRPGQVCKPLRESQ